MIYNVTLLTTAPDCDALLSIAAKEKSDLELRKRIIEKKRIDYEGSSVEIEAELKAVLIQVSTLESMIPTLPEGDTKAEQESNLAKLVVKRYSLVNRRETYGTLALLQKEFDINCLEKDIAEVDAFMIAIKDRKMAI